MKWYLAIIAIGLFSCGREIVLTDEEIKTDIFYTDQGHKPYTGTCKIYFSKSDQIKDEFRYRKGRLHGESLSWYRNGNLRWKGYYDDGRITGIWQNWDEDGNLIMEANYVNDSLEGSFITMYPNGNIREEGIYAGNNRVGEWVIMDKNGQLIGEK